MKNIIEQLSWNEPYDVQRQAIQTILSNDTFDFTLLFQPSKRKDCWENCANILVLLDDDQLENLLPGLFEWLKDLNWPGAKTILGRLKEMPAEKRNFHLIQARNKAIQENDQEWLQNLQEF